ncbi:MAG: cytochrome c [Pirellulales bacterium]|nr:cytochrome c [Pirellulales bacterium]
MGWTKLAAPPLLLLLIAGCLAPVWGQQPATPRKVGRAAKALAPRPKFDAAVRDRFFTDVREHLGPGEPGRPVVADQASPVATAEPATPEPGTTGAAGENPPAPGSGAHWAALIARDNLEDEIKAQVALVAEAVKSPSKFKSGNYRQARTSFSLLAMLLGVVAQYDGEVRWRGVAAGLRDQLAHVALNCKVGTDGSYKEAKARSAELAEMVRGDAPAGDAAPSMPDGGWAKVSDRAPLMARMEESQRGRLDVWTADAGEFKRQRDKVLHEARLLAVLTAVIQDSSYEFADDEQYLKFAQDLAERVRELVAAVEQDDPAAAQSAVSRANQACDRCHTDFRG